MPVNSAGRPSTSAPDGDELLEDGRVGAVAELDDGPRMSARSGVADGPADDDRLVERRTPAGMRRTTPWLQQARVSWANLSSLGSEPASGDQRLGRVRSRRERRRASRA